MNLLSVSVIIPTYNRFEYLQNAIASVKNQTYKNIEIIVVNDNSSQPDYYTQKLEGVTMIHLDQNSRVKKGYPCAGYVRNQG
jgi:GT2 family glycosyltransferase